MATRVSDGKTEEDAQRTGPVILFWVAIEIGDSHLKDGKLSAGDGGAELFRSMVTFFRGSRPEFALRRPLEFPTGSFGGGFHVGREFLLLALLREVRRGQRRRPRYCDQRLSASAFCGLLRPLPSTSRALRRSRIPMRLSRSPRVRPRKTQKRCRRASTQRPIRARPRRSLAARSRWKPWPGPHSPMSTPIGRHQMTRCSSRATPTLVLCRATHSRV